MTYLLRKEMDPRSRLLVMGAPEGIEEEQLHQLYRAHHLAAHGEDVPSWQVIEVVEELAGEGVLPGVEVVSWEELSPFLEGPEESGDGPG